MTMPSVTYECEDCGHQEEHTLHLVRGASPEEDDYEEEGEEQESCPKCGSTNVTSYTDGIHCRDEGREDFHDDG